MKGFDGEMRAYLESDSILLDLLCTLFLFRRGRLDAQFDRQLNPSLEFFVIEFPNQLK